LKSTLQTEPLIANRLNLFQHFLSAVFLLIFFCTSALTANDYLWPTNSSKLLSSSFGEYRDGHFHAAIDIKTWNQEGYPCYAVGNGQISRIRVSPFGYGKVIYLKLDDGNTAVYAHLQKFAPELDRAVLEQQIRNKRYSLNWEPQDRRVKKGQIIGYTGQSGSGSPHLHFEIRNSAGHPVNPLDFYTEIKDRIAPVMQSLLIIPMDERSSVNGSFLPVMVNLKTLPGKRYLPEKKITARGRIGLALMGYDLADGASNKLAWRNLKLFANKRLVFNRSCNELDYETSGQVDIEIDYPRKAAAGEVYNKLFIDSFNELNFYNRELGNGIFSVDEDTLAVEIQAADYFGNMSRLNLKILPDHSSDIFASNITKSNGQILMNLNLPVDLQSLTIRCSPDRKAWQRCDYYEVIDRKVIGQRQSLLIKIPDQNINPKYIEAEAVLKTYPAAKISIDITQSIAEKPAFKILNVGKYLVFEVQNVPAFVHASLQLNRMFSDINFPVHAASARREAVIPSRLLTYDTQKLTLFMGGENVADTSLSFLRLLPGENQSFVLLDNLAELKISPSTVYDTLLFTVDTCELPAGLTAASILSPFINLSYNGQVFKNHALLSMKYKTNGLPARQVGLYRVSTSGELNLAGQSVDSLDQRVTGKISALGCFVVAADTVPPEINIILPSQKKTIQNPLQIKFTIRDQLSGIPSDEMINVELDGQFVLAEWDPESDTVMARPHWTLKPGKHDLRIRVTDAAGNLSQMNIPVTLMKGKK